MVYVELNRAPIPHPDRDLYSPCKLPSKQVEVARTPGGGPFSTQAQRKSFACCANFTIKLQMI